MAPGGAGRSRRAPAGACRALFGTHEREVAIGSSDAPLYDGPKTRASSRSVAGRGRPPGWKSANLPDPARCNSLWIGPRLGAVQRACLRSALRHGHEPILYCYRPPDHVPDGVKLRDASAIVPESAVIRHRKTGSVALFSNLFRYELQRRGEGLWIDADVYLLAPITFDRPHLFGWQEPGLINNAVLRLPPDSPLIPALLEPFEERTVPSWLPLRARLAAHWRRQRSGRADLSLMPWGSAGPLALTALARRHGLDREALPSDIFYPVNWRNAGWIADPAIGLDRMITPATIAIHLWNETIRDIKDQPAAPGSFLARLQEEGR